MANIVMYQASREAESMLLSLPVSAAQKHIHSPGAAAAGTHSPCAQHALHPELAASHPLAYCTKPSNGNVTSA